MRTIRIVLLIAFLPHAVHAAGFELDEQDVELMGTAFAGRAAAATNASVIYFNPAAMAGLKKGWNYNAGIHALIIDGAFKDGGSTSAAGTPMEGATRDNGGENGIVPNLYLSRSFGDRWVAGIGLNVPFGLSTEWSKSSTVRYFATNSEITVININPAASFRINKQWSIGAGVSIQYLEATLENQIDFGTIGFGNMIPGLLPQQNDGGFKVSGDNWGFGWTAGALFEINEGNRIGFSFRSAVVHTINGRATYDVPEEAAPIVGATGAFVDTDAEVRLTLPSKVILSGYHKVHDTWAVVWDVAWTEWSRVETLKITYANPNQPTTIQDFSWRDSWRVSVGGIWELSDRWTFRMGVAWDQSPVPDSTRGPRLADNDRIWLALGVSYEISEKAVLHFSYFHLFIDPTSIDITDEAAGNLRGRVNAEVDAFSLGITGTF
ncbi:MAG: outer membrane protein transport protein [Planctomycetota bacterium]